MNTRRRSSRGGARAAVASLAALAVVLVSCQARPQKRPKVAAIITEFTFRSHAHVILENFLEPYYFNGELTDPGVEVVSLYVDQFPGERDMARSVCARYGIPIYPSIAEALCLGGDTLAVDGVLSIAEHGDYPVNEKGQRMYPRKRFFDEITAVFEKSGSSVPTFNDKHLSYRWDWAKEMYDRAASLNVPLLAGSSVPLAQRRPPLELTPGVEITEALSVHGGPLETYDFHSMEVLQSLIELRRGGESGVARIRFLEGDAVWEAAARGEWSVELARAAMGAELGKVPTLESLKSFIEPLNGRKVPSHAILITYRDGLRATILRIGSSDFRWNFACTIAGESAPRGTAFYVGPWRNRNLFKALSRAIQTHIITARAPYPAARTLLVTGMLDAAMESRHRGGVVVETPQLDVVYQPTDFRAVREMGTTWKIITEDMPEPEGVDPGGPGSTERTGARSPTRAP